MWRTVLLSAESPAPTTRPDLGSPSTGGGPDGELIPADELSRVTAGNPHGEFAEVIATGELLS